MSERRRRLDALVAHCETLNDEITALRLSMQARRRALILDPANGVLVTELLRLNTDHDTLVRNREDVRIRISHAQEDLIRRKVRHAKTSRAYAA